MIGPYSDDSDPFLKYRYHAGQVVDVLGWITVHHQEIGPLARLEGAYLVQHAKRLGSVLAAGQQRLGGRQTPMLHQCVQLSTGENLS